VQLVGFIIRIYHDARSPERQIHRCQTDKETHQNEFYSKNKFEKLVHLVGFIIRIYKDARSPERQKCGMDLYGSGYGKVGGFFEKGNDTSGSVKCIGGGGVP